MWVGLNFWFGLVFVHVEDFNSDGAKVSEKWLDERIVHLIVVGNQFEMAGDVIYFFCFFFLCDGIQIKSASASFASSLHSGPRLK